MAAGVRPESEARMEKRYGSAGIVGWESLSAKGRCAMRSWYRQYRKFDGRNDSRALVAAQVWGVVGGATMGWSK